MKMEKLSVKDKLSVLFLVLVLVITYRFLFVLPWGFVAGSFDVADVALVLIIFGVGLNSSNLARQQVFSHPLAIIIYMYLVMVSMHVALASFNYSQGLFNGIVAVRYQFFYLLFFLAIALLRDEKRITFCLDMISVVAIFALVIGIVNYSGYKVLFHYKADGWGGVRAGFDRIFIPGMPLLAFSVLWQLSKWVNKVPKLTLPKLGLLAAGIVLHRGRGLALGLAFVSFVMMIFMKKYKALMIAFFALVLAAIIAEFTMEQNIILYPIEGVSEGIEADEGEGGRFDQLEHDIKKFKEHPWIGSGLIALRVSEVNSSARAKQLSSDVRLVDLGYSHWVKHYGLLGILWLLFFYGYVAKLCWDRIKIARHTLNPIDLFVPAYLGFVFVTTILHNHLMVERRVVLLSLVLAILVIRSKSESKKERFFAEPPDKEKKERVRNKSVELK